jgi:hypothetical protein
VGLYKQKSAHSHAKISSESINKIQPQDSRKIQNSPHPHVIPQYRTKTQYGKDEDIPPPLSKEETKYIQAVA